MDGCYPEFGVLLVDDEPSYLRSLSILLERKGGINNIFRCDDSREVMSLLDSETIGLILLDLTMPHISGLELLGQIAQHHPEIAVIIVSGLNQVDSAVSCLKQGAFDYFVKTTEEDRLIEGIRRTIRMQEMRRENSSLSHRILHDTLSTPEVFEGIVTQSHTLQAVFRYIESIAKSSQPLLMTGEFGTGKNLLAKACHDAGKRSGAYHVLNVHGLDEQALALALFGMHEKGFSQSPNYHAGLLDKAEGGTLYLYDIGELDEPSQVLLQGVLQKGEYCPMGSEKSRLLKTRIITSTAQNLEARRDDGSFRKDLYYRLCTHKVKVPTLRSRKDDVPLLLDYFIESIANTMGKPTPSYPPELPVLLCNYDFPGNVAELKSLISDALSRHRSRLLSMEVFRQVITPDNRKDSSPFKSVNFNPEASLPSLSDIGDQLIDEAMRRTNNNQSLAARILGISQPALCKRLKKKREA